MSTPESPESKNSPLDLTGRDIENPMRQRASGGKDEDGGSGGPAAVEVGAGEPRPLTAGQRIMATRLCSCGSRGECLVQDVISHRWFKLMGVGVLAGLLALATGVPFFVFFIMIFITLFTYYLYKRCVLDIMDTIPSLTVSPSNSDQDPSAAKDRRRRRRRWKTWGAVGTVLLFLFIVLPLSLSGPLARTEPLAITIILNFIMVAATMTSFYISMIDLFVHLPWYWASRCRGKLAGAQVQEGGEHAVEGVARWLPGKPPRAYRWFIRGKALMAVVLSVILTSVSFGLGQVEPRVINMDMRLEGWPSSMDGFRLVQLSDIHVGSTQGRTSVEEIVKQVMDLGQVEMVVVTGDLVDGNPDNLKETVEPLGDLNPVHGTYFVTGNHEYIHAQYVNDWIELLAAPQPDGPHIRTLRNERLLITPPAGNTNDSNPFSYWSSADGTSESTSTPGFYLAGVDDLTAASRGGDSGHAADVPGALEGRESSRASILLAHQPNHILESADFDVGLQLSGHTHAGQVWPVHFGTWLANEYFAGYYTHSPTTQVYVNRGTNQWGPPARLGSWREITVFTITGA